MGFKKWKSFMVLPLLITFSGYGLAQESAVSGTVQELKKTGAHEYQLSLSDGKNSVVFIITDQSLIQKAASVKDLKKGQTILPAVAPKKGGGGNFKGLKMPFSNMSAMQKKILGLPDMPNLPEVPNTADVTGSIPKIPKMPKIPKSAPKSEGAGNAESQPAAEGETAKPAAKAKPRPPEVKPEEDTLAKLIQKPLAPNRGEKDPLLVPKKVLDIQSKGKEWKLQLEGEKGKKTEDLMVNPDASIIQVLKADDLKKGMKVSLEASEAEGKKIVRQLVIL